MKEKIFETVDTYLVGGAIRDKLLGLPVRERDYVVVGATPAQMLTWGFEQVGADFPVFLHPVSHEEYALARTERKHGSGYKGFVFSTEDVTLEDDLKRRDLTINAIASPATMSTDTLDDDLSDGLPDNLSDNLSDNRSSDKPSVSGIALIDPYGGRQDLENRVLRHVSDAFAEDPVRVLRVARFAARFHHLGFTVADETLALMRRMVAVGEVEHLVPERVTAELFKALDTDNPQVFFLTLRDCGALAVIFPEVDALFGVPQRPEYHPEIDTGTHVMMCLHDAAQRQATRLTRYAVLCHDLGKATTPTEIRPSHHGHEARGATLAQALSQRLKVPKKYRDIAVKTAEFHTHIHRFDELKPQTLLKLFKAFGVSKDLSVFAQFIDACIADTRGRLGFEDSDDPQAKAALKLAYQFQQFVQQFDAQSVITAEMRGEQIGQAVHRAHLAFIGRSR